MNLATDPVRHQYERWPYPPPPAEDLTAMPQYLRVYQALRDLAPRFWPAGVPREDMDILVAGCGTVAAACVAQNFPQCRVVGIDISRASLDFEEKLKARHHLENLTLVHCPIEDAASLGKSFDYILCQGVLHHTESPVAALRVLGGLLAIEGVMRVALYGKYPREQVYAFQELFRVMGLSQNEESVAVVRETLSILPPGHPLQSYLRLAKDQCTDSGIVDTYLNRRDRPYTVPDCLALVAEAGLVFQGWDVNFDYYPDGPLCGNPSLRHRLSALKDEEAWQAMEIISGSMRMHEFHVCRPERDPATYRIPWNSEKLLSCVPGHCVDLLRIGGTAFSPLWGIGRPAAGNPVVPLTLDQAVLLSKIDGRHTLAQCLAAAGVSGTNETLLEKALPLMRLLWRTGYGVFCLPRGE